MIEGIVVFSCLYGYGCTQSIQAYGFYFPETVEQVKSLQNYLPVFVVKSAPALGIFIKKEMNVNLGKGITITGKQDGFTLTFNKTY